MMVAKEGEICGGGDGDDGGGVVVIVGAWGNDDGGDGHICFGIYEGCGDRIVVEHGGVAFT